MTDQKKNTKAIDLNKLSSSINTYVPEEERYELIELLDNIEDTLNGNKLMKSSRAKSIIPSGVVLPFAGGTIPEDFLLCDGSAVSRTEYPDLFAAIGTTYGSGDGSKTFNLPNLVNKFIEGSNVAQIGQNKEAGLPNITGDWYNVGLKPDQESHSGSLYTKTFRNVETDTGNTAMYSSNLGLGIDASLSNSIYGASNTVQPPAVMMGYIIKT